MNRRQVVTIAGMGLAALAGCTSDSSEPDDEGTEDNTEAEPDADFVISNIQLNGVPIDDYDVEFPADATPSQLADEFEHQLTYDTTGANGPVTSTVTIGYTDRTIPGENEPLTQEATKAVADNEYTDPDTVEQEVQLPDDIVEYLIKNPRNIQATLTAEDTQTGQSKQKGFTLNYSDQFAVNGFRAAFDSESSYETNLEDAELVNIQVEDGTIAIEYNSNHEIGTDEFNSELSGVGVYTGIIENNRTAYDLEYTVNDANSETYHRKIGNEYALDYLKGESNRQERNQMIDEILFEEMWS